MRTLLEVPSSRREAEFLSAVARSRELHGRWVSPPRTPDGFSRYLEGLNGTTQVGFWVLTEDRELAGVINISEIVRGNFRSAYLGFYALTPHQRRGYLTRGIETVLTHSFGPLRLHRIEANIQPDNIASRALVQRVGFKLEGYSPRYLKIAGRWRDHERWAITAEDWKARAH